MLRSMYSGISGLKNFQTKMDVIGNNISNVNTFGFKKSRVVFKDLMSQNMGGASAATAVRGGVNPRQVGLGSQLSAIDTIHTGGNLQTTGRGLDLAIAGDGYFIVGEAEYEADTAVPGDDTTAGTPTTAVDGSAKNATYTRAGNFYLDNNGFLVNSDGLYVLGQLADDPTTGDFPELDLTDPETAISELMPISIPVDAKELSIGPDGVVSYIDSLGNLQKHGKLVIAKFPNAEGLQKTGNNQFIPTANSGNATFNYAGIGGNGTVQSSTLEMSNVDLSEEFTEMIVAQRGFQANTRIITTSDEILQELVNLKR